MNKYAVGVLGATGYVGRELVRLLARHAGVELTLATSREGAGGALPGNSASGPALRLERIEEARLGGCDVLFSCLPHGESAGWVARARAAGVAVVDLSSDLRPPANGAGAVLAQRAVYGLTELQRDGIRGSELVANPGCYPTGALLALAPLLRRGLVAGPVVVDAASGVTGAGRSPKRELLFAEVSEDYRAYAVGNTHRHLAELRAGAARLAGTDVELVFTPHLLPVRRGILETIYVPLAERLDEPSARRLWLEDYGGEPFVRVLPAGVPSLTDAVGSNCVVVGVAVVRSTTPALQLVVAMDNLIKGAAGQAVQNMNLMLGQAEQVGLPC